MDKGFDNKACSPLDKSLKEWEPFLGAELPIQGERDIPKFREWITWNGFALDRITGNGHDGFDFAAYTTVDGTIVLGLPPETPIRAVLPGRVAQIYTNPEMTGGGYGGMVTIEHGEAGSGMFSRYVHVVSSVTQGQEMKTGDILGTLWKDEGSTTGRLVHLHFGLLSGWGTRGSSVTGGGILVRTENPARIFPHLSIHLAYPQESVQFSVRDLPGMPIIQAHFQTVVTNSGVFRH